MHHDLTTNHIQYDSIVGVIGGTLFGISHLIPFNNVLSTIILSIIGASVSFFVTHILRWTITRINEKKNKSKKKKTKFFDPN